MKHLKLTSVCIVLLLTLLFSERVEAQSIPFEQEQRVRVAAKELLEKYAMYATFSEDGVKISQEYTNGFMAIFKSPATSLVYNDINPSLKKGDVLTASEYMGRAVNTYPTGLEIILDAENIAVLSISEIPRRHGYYMANIQVKKELYGLSRQNILHSYKGDLIFQFEISFEGEKVSSIAIVSINDYTRYQNIAANSRLKGLHLSLVGEPAQSKFNAPVIVDNGLWDQSPGVGVNVGVTLTHFFNRSFGISIGAQKTQYISDFMLETYSGQSSIQMIDEDNDKYYPVYKISNLKEINSLSYLEIPISLNFRTGKAKTGFYLDLGFVYALSLGATYQVEGLSNRMGYYPDYDLLLDDVPEYGFETVVLDEAGSWHVKPSNLSITARLGLSFPISKKIYFKVGGVAVYGIDDILYNKPKHKEDFISTTGVIPTSTTLMRIGVEAGLSFKLFDRELDAFRILTKK